MRTCYVSTCLGAQPAVPHPSPGTDRVDVHTLTYPPPHHPAFPPKKQTTGDGLTAELTEEGTIPDETFQKAMVRTVEEALAAANRIGYPVMLKASEGAWGLFVRVGLMLLWGVWIGWL